MLRDAHVAAPVMVAFQLASHTSVALIQAANHFLSSHLSKVDLRAKGTGLADDGV
jgi:hypothetical protein